MTAVRGIPGKWVTGIFETEMKVGVEKVQFLPGKGFVLQGVEIYSDQDWVTPLFIADQVSVQPDWGHRLLAGKGNWLGALKIEQGKLETNLGTWSDDLVTNQMLVIHKINAEMVYTGEVLKIENFRARLDNVAFSIQGSLPLSPDQNEDLAEQADQTDSLARISRNAAKAVSFLEGFQFEETPLLELSIKDPEGETSPEFTLNMDHRGVSVHRGYAFQEITIDAVYKNSILDLKDFMVRESSDRFLKASGEVQFVNEVFSLSVENNLRRVGLEALLPFSLGSLLDTLQLRLEDRCDFVLQIGQNTFENPGKRFSGVFYVENGFYRDAFFQELSMKISRDGPDLKLWDVEGVLGQGKGKGDIIGNVQMGFESGFVEIEVEGEVYPDFAISMVGSFAEGLLREWEFRGAPPKFSAKIYRQKKGAPFSVAVEAEGNDLLWRGTSFDHLKGNVDYQNQALKLTDLKASRGEEKFTGQFIFSPEMKACDFEMKSSFYLPDILALVGPEISQHAQPFRFLGPCLIESQGFLDLSGKHEHDLTAKFQFQDVAYQWMAFNLLTGSVVLKGQMLSLPQIMATLDKGSVSATFNAEETFMDKAHFDLSLFVKQMDLFQLITKATDVEDTAYTGKLNLELAVKGNLKNTDEIPRAKSFTGSGRLEIKDGTLFKIPLLLGLSRILSKVINGFGYASQNDFSADFKINDGVVKSDKLFLQGNLLSIAGPGSYRFADQKISADLKIQLFKEGILSDALKIILWPIRKLIEVQLTGTIDNPDWQPKNLPREIFGK